MNDIYQDHSPRAQKPRQYTKSKSSTSSKSRFFPLLLKQTAAAVVCTLLVWCMHTLPVTRLNQWMDALGRALRYESDLTDVKETGTYIINWFSELFSPTDKQPVQESPEQNPDNSQGAAPATSQQDIPSESSGEITEH